MAGSLTSPVSKGAGLRRVLRHWQLYLLILPTLAYFLIFHYWPMYGVQIAFRNFIPGVPISQGQWVGLSHFARFIGSPQFPQLMGNTIKLSLLSLMAGFPVPILLALVINEVRSGRFQKLAQNITYAPHFISIVVMSGMIIAFLDPASGVINKAIQLLGHEPVDFMSKPDYFRSIYVISGIWQSSGWNSIIYIAALSGIDPSLHEAAQIDGASRLQRIRHINLPGILPTMIMLLIMNTGSIMNVGFEKAFLLQNPLNLEASEIISTYVYKVGLINAQFSYTAAIGLFNSVINFALLVTVNAISKRLGETSLW